MFLLLLPLKGDSTCCCLDPGLPPADVSCWLSTFLLVSGLPGVKQVQSPGTSSNRGHCGGARSSKPMLLELKSLKTHWATPVNPDRSKEPRIEWFPKSCYKTCFGGELQLSLHEIGLLSSAYSVPASVTRFSHGLPQQLYEISIIIYNLKMSTMKL